MVEQSGADDAIDTFNAEAFGELAPGHRYDGQVYARVAAQDPKYYAAILGLGRIALLSNRLDDARKWLEKAIILQPEHGWPKCGRTLRRIRAFKVPSARSRSSADGLYKHTKATNAESSELVATASSNKRQELTFATDDRVAEAVLCNLV
jgi:hypothetical protein